MTLVTDIGGTDRLAYVGLALEMGRLSPEQMRGIGRIAMLNAKTDAQLAAMKLRRADIPNHVFQDLFYS